LLSKNRDQSSIIEKMEKIYLTHRSSDLGLNGTAIDGTTINGTAINGTAINGTAINATAINGTAINGTAINGTAINGTAINGTAINGTAINGTAINGTAINGYNCKLFKTGKPFLAKQVTAVDKNKIALKNSIKTMMLHDWKEGEIFSFKHFISFLTFV